MNHLLNHVPVPLQMTRFSDSGENNRAIKKQSEIIGSLQKSLASLESRLVDYQVRNLPPEIDYIQMFGAAHRICTRVMP